MDTNHPSSGATVTVPGSEIVLGPSSNTGNSGVIEHATVESISSNVLTLKRNFNHSHITNPWAAYDVGDQVIIRTVPLGWTPSSSFSTHDYGVRPARRYLGRDSLAYIESDPGGINYMPVLTDYEHRKGVALVSSNITSNNSRYIEKFSNVNTMNPRVRRYRSSWYYRLLRATASASSAQVDVANASANIVIGVATGDGVIVFPVAYTSPTLAENTGPLLTDLDGDGNNDLAVQIAEYTSSSRTGSWTFDSKLMSYSSDDTNTWDYSGNVSTNPSGGAFNRANKWFIRARLKAGENAEFDLDDMIIEHAHGTSMESSGYYEIDDYADPDTISWKRVDQTTKSSRMANGSMRISALGDSRPRYSLSADFVNVSGTIYDDIEALVSHQRRTGDMICIRPFGTVLPAVMVGKLSMSKRDLKHWDLGKASFTIEFEEA